MSVRASVRLFVLYYQSKVFVCVSNNHPDTVDRLLILSLFFYFSSFTPTDLILIINNHNLLAICWDGIRMVFPAITDGCTLPNRSDLVHLLVLQKDYCLFEHGSFYWKDSTEAQYWFWQWLNVRCRFTEKDFYLWNQFPNKVWQDTSSCAYSIRQYALANQAWESLKKVVPSCRQVN